MRILLALALVIGIVRDARAEGGVEPEPPPVPYRNMMIAMDAGASLFWIGGSALTYRSRNCACEDFSGQLAFIGVMMYVSWGAFAHHEADRDDRAVASVVIRAGLPIATGLLAHEAGASGWESFLAAGGGMVGAMAIDWFLLADATAPGKPKPQVSMYGAPSDRGMTVGLAGRF